MRKLLNRKIAEQGGKCGICHEAFTECSEIVPDHIEPREWERHDETIIQTIFRLCIAVQRTKRIKKGE